MQNIDFAVFVELWNMGQGFRTPSIHYRMAVWLQQSWEEKDHHLLLQAFRASGKSTMIGLFSAWLLLGNPDLRILVMAAESKLATKMVRNIRKIIEKHILTAHLIPQQPDQWASDRFTVKRNKELRDPSVLGLGITSNATGSRADLIVYDDVEVPNTCNSVEKRENLRHSLTETNFILVPGGTQIFIGTPHTYFSIYADKVREEINEEKIFLDNYKRYDQPIWDEHEKTVWPEQFSDEDIAILYKKSGPNKFASQMMLQPVNVFEGRLDINLLQFYKEDLVYAEAQQKLYLTLGGKKIISASVWWDPAFGSAKGDNSVVAFIFTDSEGRYYLHHLHYMQVEAKDNEDEASLQCQQVVRLIEKFYIPALHIEINGIGKFLPAILKRELALKNISCAVVENTSRKPKAERILESFDAILAAKNLYVHESVKDTPFLTEMMEWQPERSGGYDDGLDAVAGALSLEPVRIKNIHVAANRKWMIRSNIEKADTEFEV